VKLSQVVILSSRLYTTPICIYSCCATYIQIESIYYIYIHSCSGLACTCVDLCTFCVRSVVYIWSHTHTRVQAAACKVECLYLAKRWDRCCLACPGLGWPPACVRRCLSIACRDADPARGPLASQVSPNSLFFCVCGLRVVSGLARRYVAPHTDPSHMMKVLNRQMCM
jgi:hypothetical protein